jgi:hypothetical protein
MGSDPEVFVANKDGEIFMCIETFPGTKEEPFLLQDDVSILEDNVLFEYNVAPSYSKEEFVGKHLRAFETISQYLSDRGAKPVVIPCYHFNLEELDRHYQAMQFGCDPDFNAWSRKITPKVDAYTPIRSAAGHIHFGIDGFTDHTRFEFVQLLDAILMVPMLDSEIKSERRTLYGKAGAMRVKPYGVEYRTPSNFWINSRDHMELIWDIAEEAVERLNNGERVDPMDRVDIFNAINDHDDIAKTKIIEKYAGTIADRARLARSRHTVVG